MVDTPDTSDDGPMVVRVLAALSVSMCLLVTGCTGDKPVDQSTPSAGPVTSNPGVPSTKPPGTLGAFCAAYQKLEEVEASADNDEPGSKAALRAALDKIVSIGPPEDLPRAARIGMATQLETDYASVGVKFDRSTIEIGDGGSPDPAVDLADYINRHCPPRT